MVKSHITTLTVALSLSLVFAGCGDDDDNTTDSGTGSDATTSTDADTQDAGPGVDAGGDCTLWEITYDLTGSLFTIADTPMNAGDQVNTVAEPYTADDHVGPGTIVLRFQSVSGAPGGLAGIYSYDMAMTFVVDSGFTVITTDLNGDAGPEACGVTTGTLAADTVAWSPSALVDHHSVGSIVCTGNLCSMGGFEDGVPVPVDDTTDHPLSDFVFATDLSSFTMANTVVQTDSNSTTSWEFVGTETSRQEIQGPACWCP